MQIAKIYLVRHAVYIQAYRLYLTCACRRGTYRPIYYKVDTIELYLFTKLTAKVAAYNCTGAAGSIFGSFLLILDIH